MDLKYENCSGDSEKLDDSEIKRVYTLEYLATVDFKELVEKKIGFSKEKFVVMKVYGNRCDSMEVPIGKSLYELFKNQAEKGIYKSAKEFLNWLEAPISSIN